MTTPTTYTHTFAGTFQPGRRMWLISVQVSDCQNAIRHRPGETAWATLELRDTGVQLVVCSVAAP